MRFSRSIALVSVHMACLTCTREGRHFAAKDAFSTLKKSLQFFFLENRKTRRFSSVKFSSRNQMGGKYQAKFEKFRDRPHRPLRPHRPPMRSVWSPWSGWSPPEFPRTPLIVGGPLRISTDPRTDFFFVSFFFQSIFFYLQRGEHAHALPALVAVERDPGHAAEGPLVVLGFEPEVVLDVDDDWGSKKESQRQAPYRGAPRCKKRVLPSPQDHVPDLGDVRGQQPELALGV
jgi:hypothetical protein